MHIGSMRITVTIQGIEAWDGYGLSRYPRGQGWTPRSVAKFIDARLRPAA